MTAGGGSNHHLNTDIQLMIKKKRNQYHYQHKHVRKDEHKIKRSKLLDSCLKGDLFSEVKELRKSKPIVALSMEG